MIKCFNKTYIKVLLYTGVFSAGIAITPSAFAGEVFADTNITNGFASSNHQAVMNYNTCVGTDLSAKHHSKALRACSKALRASVPNYEIKSNILLRRGLLQLSSGRYKLASRDFKMAARLNGDNQLATLAQGYTAVLNKDYKTALALFNNCANHEAAAPLALYGRAITKEMSGDSAGAYQDYQLASQLKPGWDAPRQELKRISL